MFRTINQDYGSFYYRKSTSPCIPDVLKEKVYKRHEQLMNCLVRPASDRQGEDTCETNFFPSYQPQTVRITHRKKFPTVNTDDLRIDYLVKQIQQRLKDIIDPSDYPDVFKCAKLLVTEFLSQEPSLCAEDILNRVIAIMNMSYL